MSEPADQARPADDDMTRLSGWDSLLDDLFGLNVRALRTVGVAIARPSRVFSGARDRDWLDRYTPSLRLVFTLMTATVVLRFFWGGDQSSLMASIESYIASVPPDQLPLADPGEVAQQLLNRFFVLLPFTYFGCHFVTSLFVRVWGKGTPAPVRIRLYFAALLPALAVGLLLTVPYGLVPVEWLDAVTLVNAMLAPMIYAATVFAGLAPVFRAGARAWRAVLFAMVAVLTDLMVSFLTFLLAYIWLYV